MRITNPKITKALEEGRYIRSDNFPKYCMLKLEDHGIELFDWGQSMGGSEFIYNNFLKIMKDSGFYVCDEEGNKID